MCIRLGQTTPNADVGSDWSNAAVPKSISRCPVTETFPDLPELIVGDACAMRGARAATRVAEPGSRFAGRDTMPMVSGTVRDVAAALMIAALLIAALVLGRDVLVPLALATILAFILAPIVRRLTQWRVPRGLAVGLAVGVTMLALIGASVVFSAQLLSLTASLAGYKDNLVQKVRMVTGSADDDGILRRAANSVDVLEKALKKELASRSPGMGAQTTDVTRENNAPASAPMGVGEPLGAVIESVAKTGLTVLFTVFLLIQFRDLRDRLVRVAGVYNMTATTAALSDAGSRLSRLFLYQAALNGGFGVFIAIALWLIGVPNPALWGVATAVLRFVPFIGSILSALPPILLAAAVDPGWTMVVLTIILFVVGDATMGQAVEPLVLGKRIGLSPFAMVAAASFWTMIWGPVGLVLAAPWTMALVVLGQYIPRLEFLSILLGDSPALSPDEQLYHRILSDDAISAAEQIGVELEAASAIAVGDSVVLPALRLAARDHRLGRFDSAQITDMASTFQNIVELVRQAAGDVAAVEQRSAATVVMIPARGAIDAMAARYAAAAISTHLGCYARSVEQTSGLMALTSLKDMNDDAVPAMIVILTVGGTEPRHLHFLVQRAELNFPLARVVVCDATGLADETGAPARKPDVTKSSWWTLLAEVARMVPSELSPTRSAPAETAEVGKQQSTSKLHAAV